MKYFILIIAFIIGCGQNIKNIGAIKEIHGKITSSNMPIGNIIIVFHPIENGYVTEIEVNEQGLFAGELIPGKYIYYFINSKKTKTKISKKIDIKYMEPKMENLIDVGDNEILLNID